MNVLSLFDGMSCGQIALNRAGLPVDNYYASEIDKHAIAVTQHNYPNTIQVGDVTQLTATDLPNIDLIIGGSPCQGFSFAGKGLNFDDPRSKLFFEFVRLIKELKPKYWMLENVKMKKEWRDVISEYLGREPVEINSAIFSAQNRRRYYWANFEIPLILEDKGIVVADILEDDVDEKYYLSDKAMAKVEKYSSHGSPQQGYKVCTVNGKNPTITARGGGVGGQGVGLYSCAHRETKYRGETKAPTLTAHYHKEGIEIMWAGKERYRRLTPTECERLQTVPSGYTACVSDTQRYRMLGNGWTVDVIAHILKGIQNEH